MSYHFALENTDYSDLSAGRVLYSQPGQTAFPVRLASEIFQRCQVLRAGLGLTGPVSIYDPCCGGAYLLTVLGFLHGGSIAAISASDISPHALELARRNLSLLSLTGMDRRLGEINHYLQTYGKASHQAALESGVRLRQALASGLGSRLLPTHVFPVDACRALAVRQGLAGRMIDLVLADIPYGWKSAWSSAGQPGAVANVGGMLDALHPGLPSRCLLAIASDKQQKVAHPDYRRLDRFQIGKRQVTILVRAGD